MPDCLLVVIPADMDLFNWLCKTGVGDRKYKGKKK
jgi:hypothetical protein